VAVQFVDVGALQPVGEQRRKVDDEEEALEAQEFGVARLLLRLGAIRHPVDAEAHAAQRAQTSVHCGLHLKINFYPLSS